MVQVVRPPIQPHESRWLTINFDAKGVLLTTYDGMGAILTKDSLATLSSFVCTKVSDDSDVTTALVETGSPAIIGNKVTFLKKAGGGTDGEDYKYTAIVTTTLGETLEEDLILEVRET